MPVQDNIPMDVAHGDTILAAKNIGGVKHLAMILATPAGVLYTAGGGGGATIIWNDIPVGAINGVNTVFMLSDTPSPSTAVLLFMNGLLQLQGADYTIAGDTITYLIPPTGGDVLVATYQI